ncbi:aminoacylase-1A-like [Contarinia nasturtii]|uniref:aminoacylase-1A-like n=1 Tax=Contarinia nasturtii TaxID=265458 RepID=UPI0012D46E79|nr:aminoacylase-1A-like [Contarinia nasturtii]
MERRRSISTKKSFISRYVLNLQFLLMAFLCVLIIIGVVYFTSGKEAQSENSNNKTQNKPVYVNTSPLKPSKWDDNEEINIFREYLRIPSVHPNVDYEPCVEFLKQQAASLNLPIAIYYPVDDQNPVVVITWKGSQPELPAIMLNSHMDVVPVYVEYWTHPPFGADIDDNDDIFARGTQDMKSVGMQYLAAIRSLQRDGVDRLKRTVHIVYVPDEEVGGKRGMVEFVKSVAFKSLNVTFVLDEGSVAINDEGVMPVYHAERTIWQLEFIFHGQSGHGSKLLNYTPGEKFNLVLRKFMEFRAEESRKLNELNYPYGNVTTINLTKVKGGVENNVIPAEMSATFDIRIAVDTDLDEFNRMINGWCTEAGGDITIKALNKGEKEKVTPVDDSNPFWSAFKSSTEESGIKIQPMVLWASSDMRYIRRYNIPAFGFSPLMNTVAKLHDHNEYINVMTYLNGINVYKKIIPSLANV